MKQVREKDKANNINMIAPGISSKYVVQRKSLIEIKYKMPVLGKDVCYHFGFNGLKSNKWHPNEQGWDFQQMFFNESLSGKTGWIRYNPSIWLGKYNPNRTDSWIDFAVPDFQKNDTKKLVMGHKSEYV